MLVVWAVVTACVCVCAVPSAVVASVHSSNAEITTAQNRLVNKRANGAELTKLEDNSVEMAMDNCRKQFEWDRWNCPAEDFLQKRFTAQIDREAAFVQALSVAAMIFTATKNLSHNDWAGCKCERTYYPVKYGDNGHNRHDHKDVHVLTYSDCYERAEFYGEQIISAKYLNRPSLDAQGYANIHNRRAGHIAVRNSFKKQCRCHGLSGSCSTQTCWLLMDSFPEIVARLRKMYDHSVRLLVDNNGKIANMDMKRETLVYIIDSPNYCDKMRGRQCFRSKNETTAGTTTMTTATATTTTATTTTTTTTTVQQRRSCKTLCKMCGLRVRKQQRTRQIRCNCKFNWCCDVTCGTCTEVVDNFFCY